MVNSRAFRACSTRLNWRIAGLVFAALTLPSLLSACAPARAIQIGYVSEISGRNSILGVQGRNGAQLAVDHINGEGGIRGAELELVVRDDKASKEELLSANLDLIHSNVKVITGHITSWESMTALNLFSENEVILFSPTASTPALTGLDDYFFRTVPANTAQSHPLANYMIQTLNLRTFSIIHDRDNLSYTQPLVEGFQEQVLKMGGETLTEIHFSSAEKPDFKPLVQKLMQEEPDGILIVASSLDAALIAQQIKKDHPQTQIALANWSYTSDLVRNGGAAIEGALIASHFDEGCDTPEFSKFKEQFYLNYHQYPSFVSVFAYETILILADALEKNQGNPDKLKEQLAEPREFQGLCETIRFDSFGDVKRNAYLLTIQQGKTILLETYPPTDDK